MREREQLLQDLGRTTSGAALLIEVVAGVLPNEPMPEYTKRWSLTRKEFEDKDTWRRTIGDATFYMLLLQDPSRVNWVRLDWIWV